MEGGLGSLLRRIAGDNDFLSGGLLLMLVGAAFSFAYRLLPRAWVWLARRTTVSAQVRDEQVFVWLGDWIQGLDYGTRCRRLSVDVEHLPPTQRRAQVRIRLVFAPGRGSHVFRYAGRWFWLERSREEVAGPGGVSHREFYHLRTVGRDPAILKDILNEAARNADERRRGKVGICVWNRHAGWRELQVQEGRGLDSIVLPSGVKERITEDLRSFRESREWYHDLGIPYRRGYLFHGPPGCGKTSFAHALAAHFGMSIYLVSLSAAGMSDEALAESLNAARPGSILLLADVDAAFRARKHEGPSSASLTFSGLLNAIDGVTAQEGRIVIMTTNHPERLDPALVRPGRVDIQQAFGPATADQVRSLFLRFYPDQSYLAEALAERVPRGTLSMAALQGIFLQARDRPVAAVRGVLEGGCWTRWRSGRESCRRGWPTAPPRHRPPRRRSHPP